MAISETKMQMVIANYFKDECDVNTSIRQAFEKGFRIGVKKGASTNRPQGEWIEQEACWQCSECGDEYVLEVGVKPIDARMHYCPNCGARMLAKDTNGNVKLCGKCMSELLMWLDADDFCSRGERREP